MVLKHRIYWQSATCVAALFAASPALSQATDTAAAAPASGGTAAAEIVVTGIRASQARAIETKRNYDSTVEVISAEDIGKMPDKNVADALQKLPGVTTLTGSGGNGGYDENDRVALRGTTASFTLVTLNGHALATADWDPGDQIAGGAGSSTGGASRSVSFLLLPSEIVSQAVVHKTPQADDLDGGLAGSIDIITRRPLDFKDGFTAQVSGQGVYADLAKKTSPQFNGLVAWKNDADTFGVMLQGFYEERHIRRDGESELAWSPITATQAAKSGDATLIDAVTAATAASKNVYYLSASTNALFEQTRKRMGGTAALEYKPADNLTINLDGFYSKLDAHYTNNRIVIRPGNSIVGGSAISNVTTADVDGYTVVTGATFANTNPNAGGAVTSATPIGSQFESQDNPKSASQTGYVNLNIKYDPADNVHITAQGGRTKASSDSDIYTNYIFVANTPTAYQASSVNNTVGFSYPNGVSTSNLTGLAGNSGADNSYSIQHTTDKETYGQLDSRLDVQDSILKNVQIGARYAEHVRTGTRPDKGGPPENAAQNAQVQIASIPNYNGAVFPSNFGNNIGGVGGLAGVAPYIASGDVVDWSNANLSDDSSSTFNLPVSGVFRVQEKDLAAYIMGRFEGPRWHANVGVRVVRTTTSVTTNTGVSCGAPSATNGITFGSPQQATLCAPFVPAGATLITGSRFGNFFVKTTDNDYTRALPSMNFAYDVTDKLVARIGIGRVIARPDYSALGATISGFGYNPTGNPVSTASGGNPKLLPNDAWNYSGGLEWYFAKNSVLSAQVFYLDFRSLISAGTSTQMLFNTAVSLAQGGPQVISTVVTSPVNTTGYSKGIELNYEQPIWRGFGVQANTTLLRAKEKSGAPMLGSSKLSYSATGYYETGRFSARVSWSYRSKMRTGLYGFTQNYLAGNGSLSASINYDLTPHLTLTVEGLNLNNPTLRYFNAPTASTPFEATSAFYSSGRQYYFGARYKF